MTIPKFRAYIKATGEMHQVAIVNMWLHSISTIPLPKKTSYGEITNQMRLYSFDEIELMQYTGLKDINGIEIYEGDIALFKMYDEKPTTKGIIQFYRRSYILKCKGWIVLYPEFILRRKLKIIGNLHQNPELLSEEVAND